MTPRRIAGLSALAFFACVVVDFLVSDHRRPFGYAASDTYYYLNIARHALHTGRFAFDGVHVTNGFHPIWQWLLVPVVGAVELFSKQGHVLLYVVILINAAMISGALYLLGLALTENGRLTPLYGLVVFGLYGVLASVAWVTAYGFVHTAKDDVPALAGTLWSYANGMESGALILAFAVVAWLYVTRDVLGSTRESLLFGLALAAMTLCRVDHIFITFQIFCMLLGKTAQAWRARWRPLLVACVAFGIPVGLWALSNRIWFGGWVPVSGSMKSDFPHVSQANLDRIWACIRHFGAQSYFRHVRVDQQVAPMVVAALYLCVAVTLVGSRHLSSRMAGFLVAIAVGILQLGVYDLLYVDLAFHGFWYTPVSTLFVSLVFIVAVRGIRLPGWAIGLTLFASVCGFLEFHRFVLANKSYSHFYYDVAPKVVAFYGAHPPHLLENDDGIVSFSTQFPAMAGMGLALDPEGARAWGTGQIVPLAVSRGYDRLTSAIYWGDAFSPHNTYTDLFALRKSMTEEELRRFVSSKLSVPNIEAMHFDVEYFDDRFGIIKMGR